MAPDRARPLADRSPRAAENFDYHRTRHYHGRELLMRASAVRTEPHCHDVLVIDDYDETREAIMAVLESQGFTVAGAVSGPDALDMFQAGQRPCVVLLDVRMPGMDGWETWERMKAVPDLAATPVVILSADVADDARAKQVGIREFLRKPIDAKPLLAAIDRHCEHTGDPPTG